MKKSVFIVVENWHKKEEIGDILERLREKLDSDCYITDEIDAENNLISYKFNTDLTVIPDLTNYSQCIRGYMVMIN